MPHHYYLAELRGWWGPMSESLTKMTMTEEARTRLCKRIDRALNSTLTGGNDPNDNGDVVAAMRELGLILLEVVQRTKV